MSPDLAILVPSLEGGGAERAMVNLAGGFAAAGLDVDLVVGRPGGVLADAVAPPVRLVHLDRPRMVLAIPPLVRYLRERRPAAVLAAMEHVGGAALLAERRARSGARIAVGLHHLPGTGAGAGPWKRAFLDRALRRLLPRAAAVVAVSAAVGRAAERVWGLPPASVRTAPNPVVDPDLLRKAAAAPDHPWLVAGTAPVVIAVGRLVPVKNLPFLLAAFPEIHRRTGARLLVLGEGPQRAELESMGRRSGLDGVVAFAGFRSNPYPIIRAADVLVHVSRSEGFGNVLVEAMALGTPVVAADGAGGPSEILEGGRWGALVPPEDPGALAEAVVAALRPEARDQAKARASDFTVDRAVRRMAEILAIPLGSAPVRTPHAAITPAEAVVPETVAPSAAAGPGGRARTAGEPTVETPRHSGPENRP